MRRSFGWNAAMIALAAGMGWSVSHAGESDQDIGIVLASSGKPMHQDTSGRATPSAVMQTIREDDVILFDVGDSVAICNEVLGSTFEIAGPGVVRLTRSGIVSLTGSPAIRNAGSCEANVPGNSNGGVLLRTFTHQTH